MEVTAATTLKEGFVVGMRSMPGNPYDGHTLGETIEQVRILSDRTPKTVIVDRGHRGAELDGIQMPALRLEPTIGHMKTDGRLGGNWRKGAQGDALHAVPCGAGHDLRAAAGRRAMSDEGCVSAQGRGILGGPPGGRTRHQRIMSPLL